jgi:protein-disulfide isomerase
MAESKGSQGADGQTEHEAPGTAGPRRGWSRWRPYTAAVVAVGAVFAGSALIGAHVRAGQASTVKVPSGLPSTGPESLAIPIKPTVPVTLTVFEDLRSPVSRQFAQSYEPVFDQMLRSGAVTIAYRLVTQSDAKYGGTGAAQAANAAACAQDQGQHQFQSYIDELWRKQPDPSKDTFASATYLEKVGKKVKDLDASQFVPCVQDRDHEGWVSQSEKDFLTARLGDVPVVQINGRAYSAAKDDLTPQKLLSLVQSAAQQAAAQPSPSSSAAPAPQASPSPTPSSSAAPSAAPSASGSASPSAG